MKSSKADVAFRAHKIPDVVFEDAEGQKLTNSVEECAVPEQTGSRGSCESGRFRSFVSMNHPYQLVITVPSDLAGQRRTSKLTASDSWRLPAGSPAIYATIGCTL